MSRLSEIVRSDIKRSFISGYSSGGGSSHGANGEAEATYDKWYYGDCNFIVERVDCLESDYSTLLARHNALKEAAVHVYNSGYHAGHHNTVEGGYVDIHSSDMDSYNAEEVAELLAALVGERKEDGSNGYI